MSEKNTMERYVDFINENILPFIDYHKLHESYGTDMVYAKGILNRLHEAMVEVYGNSHLDDYDGDEGFVMIPGVVCGKETGKICLALLDLDLSSSGEHWGTSFLVKSGVISQSEAYSKDGTDELRAAIAPYGNYDYCYTADIPGDIHIDSERLPEAIKQVLEDFRNHRAFLTSEQEAFDAPAPTMDEAEFKEKMSALLPCADSEGLSKLITYAKELDADKTEPMSQFFHDTYIEFTLVTRQYGQEIALQLLDICKTFTLNPFEVRGAAMQLSNGVEPDKIGQLAVDGKCDPPDGESLISDKALKAYEERIGGKPLPEEAVGAATGEKPSVLEQIRGAANAPKEPKTDKPSRKKSGPEL